MHFSKIYDQGATEESLASFKKDGVELVSFDFFDTLVFRKSISHYGMWKDQSKTFFWVPSYHSYERSLHLAFSRNHWLL